MGRSPLLGVQSRGKKKKTSWGTSSKGRPWRKSCCGIGLSPWMELGWGRKKLAGDAVQVLAAMGERGARRVELLGDGSGCSLPLGKKGEGGRAAGG
jgi:hypothetical protein